jgi:hypothetical protein
VTKELSVLMIACALAFAPVALAQQPPAPAQSGQSAQPNPPAPPQSAKPAVLIPIKVQVVISRYRGDKKVSNLLYSLSVQANAVGRSSLRMGAEVPIASTLIAAKDNPAPATTAWQYKPIGTNIDCTAVTLDDGRFKLDINIEDSSAYPQGQTTDGVLKTDVPMFRSFRSVESLIMKDGQTTEYMAATDKVSGEVIKIDVSLTVVK